MDSVLQPTVDELRRRGTPFAGLLYAGLALTSRGVRVIEFNARFGDPETQVVLARLRTPLAGCCWPPPPGALADLARRCAGATSAAVTVVIASHNYPDTPRTGDPISGLDEVAAAGRTTRTCCTPAPARTTTAAVVSAGGRVLSVTATGPDLAQARERAYARGRPDRASTARTTAPTSPQEAAAELIELSPARGPGRRRSTAASRTVGRFVPKAIPSSDRLGPSG